MHLLGEKKTCSTRKKNATEYSFFLDMFQSSNNKYKQVRKILHRAKIGNTFNRKRKLLTNTILFYTMKCDF